MTKQRKPAEGEAVDERAALAALAENFVPEVPRQYQHTQTDFNLYTEAQKEAGKKIAAAIRAHK